MSWTPPDPGPGPTQSLGPPPSPPPLPPPAPLPVTWQHAPPPVPVLAGPAEAWVPRPYSQLVRGPRHRWWRPLAGLGVLLGLIGALLFAGGVATALGVAAAGGDGEFTDQQFDAWSITPAGFLVTNLFLAAFIPLAQVAVWVGHGWRPRWVASVGPGLRWRWTATATGVTALVFVPLTAGFVLLSGEDGAPERDAALLLVIVLLTTPLQAAGEEYLCRGWLTQAVGSVIPRAAVGAVVAALVSATVFALAHGQQDPWLFADRFAFGLVASWLVWRTGGLEAAIAVHTVNNLVALVPTILLGQLLDALTVTEADPVTLLVDVVSLVVVAVVLDRLARRRRLQRLFVPPTPASAPGA